MRALYKTLVQVLGEEVEALVPKGRRRDMLLHRLERRLAEEIALRFAQAQELGLRLGGSDSHRRDFASAAVLRQDFAAFLDLDSRDELCGPQEYDVVPPTAAPAPRAPLTEQEP